LRRDGGTPAAEQDVEQQSRPGEDGDIHQSDKGSFGIHGRSLSAKEIPRADPGRRI